MKDITPILIKTGNSYFAKNSEMLELQLETLSKINDHTQSQYETFVDTIKEAKETNEKNYTSMNKLTEYYQNIEQISEMITNMESETQQLDDYIIKLEAKFKEFYDIRKMVGN